MATARSIVYIDGHNFYHGCMKDSPSLKWLDLMAFAKALVGRYGAVEVVKYYTSRVVDLGDATQSQRQDIYLAALAIYDGVEIIEGRFAKREKKVKIKSTGKIREAVVYEEKGTDVNLGADLVNDSHDDLEVAVVVSNDSDLQRAVDIAVANGVTVFVANPHERGAQRRSLTGSGTLTIRRHHLADSQMPDVVGVAAGALRRPTAWK